MIISGFNDASFKENRPSAAATLGTSWACLVTGSLLRPKLLKSENSQPVEDKKEELARDSEALWQLPCIRSEEEAYSDWSPPSLPSG